VHGALVSVVRDRPGLHPWAARSDIGEPHEELSAPGSAGSAAVRETWPPDSAALPTRRYLTRPLVRTTAAAFSGYSWVLYTFLSWFPDYLVKERGVDIRRLAFAGAVPWVMGVLGFVLGGIVTDRVAARTGNPAGARKVIDRGGPAGDRRAPRRDRAGQLGKRRGHAHVGGGLRALPHRRAVLRDHLRRRTRRCGSAA
jgi:ACS family hexuronate transporter-like MFS transporter